MPTVHLIIKGKVQGVFFRASAREVAEDTGVTGWIKNKESGEVEAVVNGTDEQVRKFVHWCGQGPTRAVVTEVKETKIADQQFSTFRVIRGS